MRGRASYRGREEDKSVIGGGAQSQARLIFCVYPFHVGVSFLFWLQGVGKSMLWVGRYVPKIFIHFFDIDLYIIFLRA